MALFSFGNVNRRWITLVASWIQTLLPVWMWMITFRGQPPNYHRPAFYYHPWLWGIIVVDIDIDIDTDIDTYIYIYYLFIYLFIWIYYISWICPHFSRPTSPKFAPSLGRFPGFLLCHEISREDCAGCQAWPAVRRWFFTGMTWTIPILG